MIKCQGGTRCSVNNTKKDNTTHTSAPTLFPKCPALRNISRCYCHLNVRVEFIAKVSHQEHLHPSLVVLAIRYVYANGRTEGFIGRGEEHAPRCLKMNTHADTLTTHTRTPTHFPPASAFHVVRYTPI